MLPLGIMAVWAAYTVGSWGYVLIKGYDISFREWVSPLHPYQGGWPPPLIPDGKLWPHSAGSPAVQASDVNADPINPGGLA